MNICVSTFWLLWIVLIWTCLYLYLFEYLFSVLWGIYLGDRIAGSYVNSMFNFLRTYQTIFHSGWTTVHSQQQCTRITVSPHPCRNLLLCFSFFVGFCFFHYNHSSRSEVVSHFGFDLHFPNEKWCGASFHVLLGHLCIFFGELSIEVFCPVFTQVACLFVVDCRNSLYFLGTRPYQIYHLQILSPTV